GMGCLLGSDRGSRPMAAGLMREIKVYALELSRIAYKETPRLSMEQCLFFPAYKDCEFFDLT
ncbi:hypothetical protein, partial [Delftia tsuruhatensis]|uniref:hypothetical protein n=1 Tax=Delftia tsuruhatensis TaxID=180282 RepID=UPI001969E123